MTTTQHFIREKGQQKWRDLAPIAIATSTDEYFFECHKSEPLRRMLSACCRGHRDVEWLIRLKDGRERVRLMRVKKYIYRGGWYEPGKTKFEMYDPARQQQSMYVTYKFLE